MKTARPITSIKIGKRHRRAMGDIAALAASIEAIGLLHPVVITPEGKLIAGSKVCAPHRAIATCFRVTATTTNGTAMVIKRRRR